jgi:hypothetical protein
MAAILAKSVPAPKRVLAPHHGEPAADRPPSVIGPDDGARRYASATPLAHRPAGPPDARSPMIALDRK